MSNWPINRFLALVGAVLAICMGSVYLAACPFCSAINLTFAEQIKTNDVVVIAKLVEIPEPVDDPDAELPKSIFEITNVIKGDEYVRAGMQIRSLLVGRYPAGNEFLIMGVDPPNVSWSTPMKASQRVVGYLKTIQTLPKEGPERLEFFQNYFEDKESVLAFDAYDEFAAAPYEDVVALKDKMDRPRLVSWIKSKNTSTNRRRLYLTMLGVCGTEADIEMLEGFIKSGDRKQQAGLDALIAAYLKLKGDAGMDLIVDTFLKDKEVEYVDTLAAVTALRILGTEINAIEKDRIVGAMRTLLDRPEIADMVIPDLARWEDWTVMEKLVGMFKEADEDTSWVRVPIASYLRACPKPAAKVHIAALQKIDPQAIERADFFLGLSDDDEEDDWGDGFVESDKNEKVEADDASEVSPVKQTTPAKQEAVPGSATKGDENDDTGQPHLARRIPLDSDSLTETQFVSAATATAELNPAISTAADTEVASQNHSPSETAPSLVDSDVEELAQFESTLPGDALPIATAPAVRNVPMWQIVTIPMAFSLGIFVLLWSVISGWFDRLIY